MSELRILHLEDDPRDAELIRARLEEAGVNCRITRVDRRENFITELESHEFDLILTDYTLPAFDGGQALQVARASHPEIPFVYVSGTIGEDAAIQALVNGATDYVLKHDLRRLVPAIQRATREADDKKRRREAEMALRKSEEKYRRILETAEEGIWLVDANNVTTFANRRLAEMLGYRQEEMSGRSFLEFLDDEGRSAAREDLARLRGGKRTQRELLLRSPRGNQVWALICANRILDDAGHYAGSLAMITDVTERRQTQEQLLQSQRLESVGRLAGGIAHDFNNLLTVIGGYSDLLLAKIPADDPIGKDLREIRKAGERAAALTRQLLAFSRKQILEPKVLDLNDIVADLQKMLRRLIGEDVELTAARTPGLGRVKADPGQVEQVLMNLVVNARDAMPEGGKLTIEAANVALDEAYAAHHVAVRPGEYVMLAVSDTGCGMDEATKSRIFEPFYTTKERGKGTGLGLSTVYGIVKQSGGYVWVYSEPGQGSTFKIYLPRVEDPADKLSQGKARAVAPGGSEVVLLAEDEPVVRGLARRILESNGYTVFEARDGVEALEICERHQEVIHLMVTDVVMPKMSGRELAKRLETLRPAMKVLYLSGYTENAIVHHGVLDPGTAFLQKPFTPDHLARKVREVLDGTAGESQG